MSSNVGGGIPAGSRKMIQSLKEIVNNGVSDVEIYSALKECNMDPNEAVNRLLSQDTFHEVKSKREKKKEFKDTTESRPRGSTSNRGARSGTDQYTGRSGSTHYGSSESGGYGKPTYKRENVTSSYTASAAPATRAAPRNANWNPPTYSDSHEASTHTTANSAPVPQPSSGYQSAWLGAPGQKSMADIVKMGRPQNTGYTTSNLPQQSISHNPVSSTQPNVSQYEMPSSENFASHVPDNDWPSVEQPQAVVDPQPEAGLNVDQSNLSFDRSNQDTGYMTNEVEAQDESSSEDHIEDNGHDVPASTEPLYDNGSYRNIDSYPHEDAYEHNEVEEVDAPLVSVSENIQKLSIQEEEHVEQPEEEVIPSVVIPNHLQIHTADCSHLSFGSFGPSINTGFSAPSSSVEHTETINREYNDDGSRRTHDNHLTQGTGAESYDLPSVSQAAVLNQEVPEVTHGNQYGFPPARHADTYNSPQLLNPSFPLSQTPPQTQISTPFLSAMQDADTNTLMATNSHPVRESDLSYSQFSASQSMPTRYANTVSSINDPTISMAEALKGVGLSSSQPGQQTLPIGPTVQQHLAMHHYSQPTLPLGPYANMIGYPFLPQSYTYMPSGFQPGFAGNSTNHQQLAAMLPQYKNSVSVSSLTQSPTVASGYGSYGSSTAVPGNYQVNQPAGPGGSTSSYDDVLNAYYKGNSHFLSLQQQNENSPMWVQGGGSRTMPPVPASAYYNLQSQSQQQQQPPSGFRQGQQPSQSYGGAALNYPDFFQSQMGISQEHQLQQNPRDGSHVGGSQGQPKLQSQQQLWQNGY